MLMYKCEECGLITSEELVVCPKCQSERNKLRVEYLEKEDILYKFEKEDVNCAIHELSERKQQLLKDNFSIEEIYCEVERKVEIDSSEAIKAVIEGRFLDRLMF